MYSKTDRLFFFMFIIASLVLSFAGGAVSSYFKLWPYSWLDDAVVAYKAVQSKKKSIEATAALGNRMLRFNVKRNEEGAFQGATLFSSSKPQAKLIDMEGNVLHTWYAPFSKVWPDHPHVRTPVPDSVGIWRDARLDPKTGELLVTYEGRGDTPFGYGLVKLDKDSNVIWRYDENAHHIIDIDEDGKIYVLIHKIQKIPVIPHLKMPDRPVFSDYLAVLTPDGEEVKRISLVEALGKSRYADFLKRILEKLPPKGDLLHTNSVHVLRKGDAAAFPKFAPGQVLISSRTLSLIGVVDVDKEIFVWAKTGEWRQQHDAEFRPEGDILFFDNNGPSDKRSRILRYDLNTGKITTIFSGSADYSFSSRALGMQQVLPNGNLLITSTHQDKAFETTPEKEVVWELTTRNERPGKPSMVIFAYRFELDSLKFLK